MNTRAISQKIRRLSAGGPPRVLDLFAGCGGLSLGFLTAGCEIRASVESDPAAARSHGANFHPGDNRHARPRDINETTPAALAEEFDLGDPSRAFDIIVGGPPCQAFARVGRSKLREVAAHPEAFRHDPRSRLYIRYLDYVEACAPLAVVLENVPDMLNYGGRNIAHEISEVLTERGYTCAYTLLNAAYYGVPQMRERVILIAITKKLATRVAFPAPTHWIELPSGYRGSRAFALKLLACSDTRGPDEFWQPSPGAGCDLQSAVTAKEALEDLPRIDARSELASGKLKRGARRFDDPMPHPSRDILSEYARLMRNWPGFEAGEVLYDHVIRWLPRDYPLFARLDPGNQYPEACQHAEKMFEEELTRRREQGETLREGSKAWSTLRHAIVPPYDSRKFPNKWRKMEADQPARTLLAHLGKDGYSHIHYDGRQARTISVREAARLQSFPDGFVFSGTMNPAFKQIGNAVPPLLSKAIGEALIGQITAAVSTPTRKIAVAAG